MRTLKTILIMSILMVFATSCTDVTEDLAPNTNKTTEVTTNESDTTQLKDKVTISNDTGGGGDGNDGGKGD